MEKKYPQETGRSSGSDSVFGFSYLLAWQVFRKSSLSPGMFSVVPAVERLM